jgi:hypothetical protein
MLPELPLELVETILWSLGPDSRPGDLVLACGKATTTKALSDPRFVAACTCLLNGRIDLSNVIEDMVSRHQWTDQEASLAVANLLRFVSHDTCSMFTQTALHQLLALSCRCDMVQTLRSAMVGLCLAHVPYTTVDQMVVAACDAGSIECVKVLVEDHQADVQYAHGMPLWRAMLRERSCSGALVGYLLGRGALPRLSVVHAVSSVGQADALSPLLQLVPPAAMVHLAPQFMSNACSVGNPGAVETILEAARRSILGLGHGSTSNVVVAPDVHPGPRRCAPHQPLAV